MHFYYAADNSSRAALCLSANCPGSQYAKLKMWVLDNHASHGHSSLLLDVESNSVIHSATCVHSQTIACSWSSCNTFYWALSELQRFDFWATDCIPSTSSQQKHNKVSTCVILALALTSETTVAACQQHHSLQLAFANASLQLSLSTQPWAQTHVKSSARTSCFVLKASAVCVDEVANHQTAMITDTAWRYACSMLPGLCINCFLLIAWQSLQKHIRFEGLPCLRIASKP